MTRRSIIQRFAAFCAALALPKGPLSASAKPGIAGPLIHRDGVLVDADGVPVGAKQRVSDQPPSECCGTKCCGAKYDDEIVEKIFSREENGGALWAYVRKMEFDKNGHLVSVGPRETRRIA